MPRLLLPVAAAACVILLLFPADSAAQWTQCTGPAGGSMLSIAVFGNDEIAVSALGGGVFRSTNRGASWHMLSPQTLPDLDPYGLAYTPQGDLLAGTATRRVQRMRRNASSWEQDTAGLPAGLVSTLFATPGGTMLASVRSAGMFRRGPSSWLATTGGPAAEASGCAAAGAVIYAVFNGAGLYVSTDDGATWASRNATVPSQYATSVAVHPGGTIFYGTTSGAHRSTDAGVTWTAASPSTEWTLSVCVMGDASVLVSAMDGMFRSTDAGATWTRITGDFEYERADRLAVSASGDSYGLSSDGVHRSTDAGRTWMVQSAGLFARRVYTLRFDDAGRWYAGSAYGGLFRSSDRGASWTSLLRGRTTGIVNDVAFPAPNVIVAATNQDMFRSSNDGASWDVVAQGAATSLLQDKERGRLYTASGGDVRLSTDQGATWTRIWGGIPSTMTYRLAWGAPGQILAGTYGKGVFMSADDGASWALFGTGLDSASIMWLERLPSGDMYAGTWEKGVFRRGNAEAAWTPVNTGLPNRNITMLAVLGGGTLAAATWGDGVFLSRDRGNTWSAASATSNLPHGRVTALAALPDGRLLAGVQGNSVWVSDLPVQAEGMRTVPETVRIRALSPQPAHDHAELAFEAPEQEPTRITIRDLLGRIALTEECMGSGKGTARLDVSPLRPGLYNITLEAAGAAASRAMIIVK